MKKVSILLLLTVVLASFAFAIEGVGDFEAAVEVGLADVTGDAMSVYIEPTFTFSRDFGGFGLAATLGDVVHIETGDNAADLGDELYVGVTPSYTLAAGPGDLSLSLGLQGRFFLTDYQSAGATGYYLAPDGTTFALRIDPVINYGLDAGFGVLGFEVGTDHLQLQGNQGDDSKSFGLLRLPIYLQAGLDLPFGLGFWVKPVLEIKTQDSDTADTGLATLNLDIHYAIIEQVTAGVEVDIPTVENGIKTGGITIIPRVELSFGALGAYVKAEIGGVASDGDIVLNPIIGLSYSF